MGKYETANELAILAGGRSPQWVQQTDFDGPPSSAGSGSYLEKAIHAMLSIDLRADVSRRTAKVGVGVLDLAAVYTVAIDATGVAFDAGGAGAADLADVLDGIAAAINADVVANLVVSAVVVDETVVIAGIGPVDYSIGVVASGTGELTCVADASSAGVRVYLTWGGTNGPAGWRLAAAADYAIDWHGFGERADVAAMDRLYLELYDVVGDPADGVEVTYAPAVYVGPCVTE